MTLDMLLEIGGDGPPRVYRLSTAYPQELVDALRAKARAIEREYGLADKVCPYGHPMQNASEP